MSCLNARNWTKGMSRQEIEQRFAVLEQQLQEQDQKIEDLRKIVDNAAFWIQRLELNPEIVALRNAVQEKDLEIAELKKAIRDLQDFKSKFMDFKSQCSCSQFRDFWPWE